MPSPAKGREATRCGWDELAQHHHGGVRHRSGSVTVDSGIVTGHSGQGSKSVTIRPESPVTFGRNRRSRWTGMTGHDGPEYALRCTKACGKAQVPLRPSLRRSAARKSLSRSAIWTRPASGTGMELQPERRLRGPLDGRRFSPSLLRLGVLIVNKQRANSFPGHIPYRDRTPLTPC
jgi:hypothetical protein